MPLIDIALAAANVVYVDTSVSQDEASLLALGVLDADTVVYYGGGNVDITDILGVNALNSANIVATGGSTVTIDAGLLDLNVLTQTNLLIDGDSNISLSAGDVGLPGLLTNLLSNVTVAFSGSEDGTFTYVPPTLGILASTSITIDEMDPGDAIVVPFPGSGLLGVNELRENDTSGIFSPDNSYRDGYLHLKNGGALNQVDFRIKMSPEEYAIYSADKDAYLLASQDKFIFPGDDSDEPPYVACFTIGTMIATPGGLRAIEGLVPGDLVLTRDNGSQPLRWIGASKLDMIDLRLHENLRPIRIKANALGDNIPIEDLVVSPQHRVLVRSIIAERMFGIPEVLVAAKQLLHLDGVDIEESLTDVTYVHILLDRHEVVLANGAFAETLYLGPMALQAVGPAALAEMKMLFPKLLEDEFRPVRARYFPSGREGRRLAMRHSKNRKPLYMQ
ncbi:Hint domain-containing protein [Primorskyibacter flagellatus]|uniref:Hint domain-containing protein n=1 Tax=Primorskyibacter flagellatus TaxID=1387277 RepID=UPI003A92CE57